MRPQHITAENAGQLLGAGGGGVASMRPQHITAENSPGTVMLQTDRPLQ